MPNPNHLLIVFNKPIRLGSSRAHGYHVSADGTDIDRTYYAASGTRFIKLMPFSVDLVIIAIANIAVIRDARNNRDCIINKDDVDVIKEVETGRVIWMGPKASEIVIELDPASRPRPKLARVTSGSPLLIFLDRHSCIPFLWTVGLDLKQFPLFIKLQAGVAFSEKDAKWLEFEYLSDLCEMEKFYVWQVYEKKGGKVLWRKP